MPEIHINGIYLDSAAGDRYVILRIDSRCIYGVWLGDDGYIKSAEGDKYLGQATELMLALL